MSDDKSDFNELVDSATVAKTLANESYLGYLSMSVGALFMGMKTALEVMPQGELDA